MTINNHTIIKTALEYLKLGFPIFPVIGKIPPKGFEWKQYQTKLPTISEVEEWSKKYPNMTGIAIALGDVCGMMVIDCDVKNPKKRVSQAILDRLKSEGYIETKTPSEGSHFLVKDDPALGFTSNANVLTGVDIKAQGGYVLLPPSVALYGQDELEYARFNGKKYEWVNEYKSKDDLKPFPVWLLDMIKQNGKSPRNNKENWKNKIIIPIEEGTRNASFTSIIGGIIGRTPEKEWPTAWAEVKLINAGQENPLPIQELESIWNSIAKKEKTKIQLAFQEPVRIKKFDKIEKEVSFEEWQETIKNNFPELLFAAEIGLSIISQILIKDITNPFALVLVDVPSAGKTIVINFFSDIEHLTYASDKFTPASFVSNASNVKKEKLKEIDLLPRLKYKMLLLRDLSTLFSKRDDDLNECLGLLTRVLDGEGLNTDSGVHGQRQYVGEYLFMIFAGSTPIQPRVWKMMGSLGSRLFFLNMGAREKSDQELAEQITNLAYKEKEKVCRTATKNFLYTLWHKHPEGVVWDKTQDKMEEKIIIVHCAKLLAKLRGVINIFQESSYIETEEKKYSYAMPIIEKPDRINQLFYNLCRGHALVCGRSQINREDLKLIIELSIDSCSTIRAKLFRELINNNGTMKTSDVMNVLNCSRPTALKEMETLRILGVCHTTQESYGQIGGKEKELILLKEFEWFLGDECKQIRGVALAPKQGIISDLMNNQ